MNKNNAEQLLKTSLANPDAAFREGQWEAIDTLVNHRKKLLVVQRTGWGKSSVYFIATKLLREQGYGPTIIVSPLLALMRNQIDTARKIGVNAITVNSTNRDDWAHLTQQVLANEVDCLLISPERLANEDFNTNLLVPIAERIGLMVVDEAHCISDWGHDFRPDYRRILNILQRMPSNMPVLGTTATANNRVIDDIISQLGDIEVQRGPLVRESLGLQTMPTQDAASRLVWLSQVVTEQNQSGIVYVLTKRDAIQVSDWLLKQGIQAAPYYSGVKSKFFVDSNSYREHLEDGLLSNKIKVLVATTALGMGYDKPDLGFVIHYQAPSSIVGYYQQVGRAGRGIEHAVGVLLNGNEDKNIHAFFRRSAFPSERHVRLVLEVLDKSDGLTTRAMEEHINLRQGQIEKVLKLLSVENPSPVVKDGSKWHRTTADFQMDHERINHLTQQREIEWQEVQDYIAHTGCLMNFLRRSLDDPHSEPCGKCANCVGHALLSPAEDNQKVREASLFLRHSEFPLKPKVQVAANAFPIYGFQGNLPQGLRAETGRVLSRCGDAAWGRLVKECKKQDFFTDELVNAMVEMIQQRWQPEFQPQWVCAVPSLRHVELVPNFAERLANKLGLPFYNVVTKLTQNEQQKFQQNRYHQCKNLDGAFAVNIDLPNTPVFLVDDMVDSGWTMTTISALLRQEGASQVYPIALASMASGD
ncbi:MAG: RecQ family ATP-dependent DNA helicase [Endozoicomonadaceae bacterium]|nr:RecQ family ATP-dependent DNA helicase [Endozoicomonadaceae bacterium]